MAGEKERVEGYLATVDRLEPDLHPTDQCAWGTSLAISMKRIADSFEFITAKLKEEFDADRANANPSDPPGAS